jgi:hypothetical protein
MISGFYLIVLFLFSANKFAVTGANKFANTFNSGTNKPTNTFNFSVNKYIKIIINRR